MPATAAREDLPRFIEPMLARSGAAPGEANWAGEVKWDGIRLQARIEPAGVSVRSRPGRDCTDLFPELGALTALAGGRRRLLLDGELVCLADDGAPDFSSVRARLFGTRRGAARRPVTFVIFDVLHDTGRAVRALPYRKRRTVLDELAPRGECWQVPPVFIGEVAELAELTRQRGLEGIVAKRMDSTYLPGRRSNAWIKVKHRRREQLLARGVRAATATRPAELLLARRDLDGTIAPAGAAMLGVSGSLLEHLDLEPPRRRSGTRWLRTPVMVDVDCHGRSDGPVRDAIVRGLSGVDVP